MNDEALGDRLDKAARCLRVLAHPIRLQLIYLLGHGEQSVQELERQVQASQSSVSQHLNLLRDKDIVESRRAAQQVLYRLKDPRVLQLTSLCKELFCKENV
jgi:DNA-binding transcriptional ArsR family regulator